MPDFLLELLSEEIPARMQARARADLARLFEAELARAGLAADAIETYATPRRLALIARGLPPGTQAVREETKGPRSSAPPQALEGFLRKTGLTRDQLEERDGIYFAVVEKPGRATSSVLAEAIPAIVRAFPWPKSMRWGAASLSTESLRWVRPLQGIVALLGEEIVDFEIGDVRAGAATVGHRFHHPGPITIGGAGDYVEKLRACHVIVDPAERRRIIAEGAQRLAAAAGLALVEDEGLLDENAGLTEWPVPLLGDFDPAFLDVPPEVIQLTMRTNQKYFALNSSPGRGGLAPAFICTANIEASDGGAAIVAGNRKVLAARLADAKFFWEQDLKVPLEQQAEKLGQIVFHEKLGTVADKVDRVAKLARWLVEEGIVGATLSPAGRKQGEGESEETHLRHSRESGNPASSPALRPQGSGTPAFAGVTREELANLAERAARLAKADLVTGMVGEFPELQGVIGGYLARAQGEDPRIADAIRDHYKPVGQGDDVPTAPVTVAVSLADKLDTLFSFFLVRVVPTGSKDPYALRRTAMGVIALLAQHELRLSLSVTFEFLWPLWKEAFGERLERLSRYKGLYEHDWFPAYQLSDDKEELHLYYKEEKHARWEVASDELPVVEAWLNVLFAEEIEDTLLLDFFADRLKVQQREAGVRHDLIDAVFALGGEDDLVRLLARVKALQGFVATPEGADLLAGYKRAANILKKEGWGGATTDRHPRESGDPASSSPSEAAGEEHRDSRFRGNDDGPGTSAPSPEQSPNKILSYTPEAEEAVLIAALDSAEPRARAAIAAEDFEGAMAALASLRGPVDAFFDKVTVNDPDPSKRAARLDLLARMRDAVHAVADFSRIEG